MCLPDMSMMQGRLLVCAWEAGLTNVEEAVASLVMQSVEVHTSIMKLACEQSVIPD
ncbi:hypothetical protein DPMN_117466 [Dreissena polymorpha]|uniref:Uncharacterized protein n=1 Tax=Dreissena polymorpha TaxID=45954 RepID=A0A9D4QUC1_DREPO|nr:hypothetical protein DPMN_117466 [Dreissena polymorpha]